MRLIFAIGSAALLVLVYNLVALEFRGEDEEIILAKLKEYAAVYQAGGANALAATASQENNPGEREIFLRPLDHQAIVPANHHAGRMARFPVAGRGGVAPV
jgi:hypothetical protein